MKNRFHKGKSPRFYFWQNKTKQEIDLIIDTPTKPIPYEIKSGKTMNESWFSNLKYLRKVTGDEIANLNVIYGGDKTYKTSDGDYIAWSDIDKLFD